MKRLFVFLLAVVLALGAVPGVMATETEGTEVRRAPDECGEGIKWSFADGVLTITGDGEMDDFEDGKTPWQVHKDQVEEVRIEGKLTYIGSFAFKDFDKLLAVDFGDALREIGTEAFRSCDGLKTIWLPETFKVFGEGSFLSCKNLKEIYCSGKFPSFRQNCLWDTYATIYYPAAKPWGAEYIQQLEEAFKGRVKFVASNKTAPDEPTEPLPETEPVTEPETEPEETVPETTAPAETEVPTEPVLIMPSPTEAPETEEPTGAEAEPETEPETIPQPEKPEENKGMPMGLVIAGAALAGVLLGGLIFGRKRGKYAR